MDHGLSTMEAYYGLSTKCLTLVKRCTGNIDFNDYILFSKYPETNIISLKNQS